MASCTATTNASIVKTITTTAESVATSALKVKTAKAANAKTNAKTVNNGAITNALIGKMITIIAANAGSSALRDKTARMDNVKINVPSTKTGVTINV